jgi:hypothetical protein
MLSDINTEDDFIELAIDHKNLERLCKLITLETRNFKDFKKITQPKEITSWTRITKHKSKHKPEHQGLNAPDLENFSLISIK